MIAGPAAGPACLSIVEGEAILGDASGLWGKDLYDTTDLLKGEDKSRKVLAIGPARENLVRLASIGNDKGHYIGRTGLGAVMGAKRIKALCVQGAGKLEKDDALPKRILTPLAEGAGAGSVPDVEKLKREYYALRGLDERGFPLAEKLKELGLDELRERLYAK